MNCTSLEEITIPASVEKIAPDAFVGCTSLKNINMSNMEQSLNIENGMEKGLIFLMD